MCSKKRCIRCFAILIPAFFFSFLAFPVSGTAMTWTYEGSSSISIIDTPYWNQTFIVPDEFSTISITVTGHTDGHLWYKNNGVEDQTIRFFSDLEIRHTDMTKISDPPPIRIDRILAGNMDYWDTEYQGNVNLSASASLGVGTYVAVLEHQIQNVDTSEKYHHSQMMVQFHVQTPEPATLVLFGMGLLGIAGIGRKNNRTSRRRLFMSQAKRTTRNPGETIFSKRQ